MVSWQSVLGKIEGDPFRAEVRRFGNATALIGKGEGGASLGPLFNRVLGFTDADAGLLDEMIGVYTAKRLPCRIDVHPYAVGTATMRRLVDAGFYPFRHHDHLVGVPSSPPPSDWVIREAGKEDRATVAELLTAGFVEVTGIKAENQSAFTAATANLIGEPNWTFFIAYCEGTPAAVAALYVEGGVGSIVMAATRPEFRGRGCQTALLAARLRRAAEQGCDLVAAQAALDVSSHRNMERAGLRVAYTRTFWLRQ